MDVRLDVVRDHAAEVARRQHVQDLATNIVQALFRLARQTSMHAMDNQAMLRQLTDTVQAVRDYAQETGSNPSVLFSLGSVFVGGQLLRGNRSTYEGALELAETLRRFDVSEITIAKAATEQDLQAFVMALRDATRGKRGDLPERPSPRVRLRSLSQIAGQRDLSVNAVDPDTAVVRTYSSAIVVMRRFFEQLGKGKYTLPHRIKRVAQRLVDLSRGQTPAFLGVTSARNQNADEAGRAVNSAILALSMARQVTDDNVLLARLAMAALLYDAGRIRLLAGMGGIGGVMPRLGDAGERELPASSAAVLTALGRVNEPSVVRTVLAYEAQWARRGRELGPVYGGLRPPAMLARILAVARTYNDFCTPEPGHEAPSADQAIAALGANLVDPADRTVLRLLIAALGIFPTGTLVELSTREIALVVGASTNPAEAHLPRVRLVVDANGGTLARPIEIHLAAKPQRGEPTRRITRLVASADDPKAIELRKLAEAQPVVASPPPEEPPSSEQPISALSGNYPTLESRLGPEREARSERKSRDPAPRVITAPPVSAQARPSPPPGAREAITTPPPRAVAAMQVPPSPALPRISSAPPPEPSPSHTRPTRSMRAVEEPRPEPPAPPARRSAPPPAPDVDEGGGATRAIRWGDQAALLARLRATVGAAGDGSVAVGEAEPQAEPAVTRAFVAPPAEPRPSPVPAAPAQAQAQQAPPRESSPAPPAAHAHVIPGWGPAPAEPSAAGTFAKSPLTHLLVYMLDRRLSGTAVFYTPDQLVHGIYFDQGIAAKVRTGGMIAPLDRVIFDMGRLDEDTLRQTLMEVSKRKTLHGRLLVSKGLLSRADVLEVLRQQLVRKTTALSEMPAATSYEFFEGFNLLEGYGGPELIHCEPLALIMACIRLRGADKLIDATLAKLGDRPLGLHLEAETRRFELSRDEAAVADFLRVRRSSVRELIEAGVAQERLVRQVVYALVITRHIDLGKPPVGVGVVVPKPGAVPDAPERPSALPPPPSGAPARAAAQTLPSESFVDRSSRAAPPREASFDSRREPPVEASAPPPQAFEVERRAAPPARGTQAAPSSSPTPAPPREAPKPSREAAPSREPSREPAREPPRQAPTFEVQREPPRAAPPAREAAPPRAAPQPAAAPRDEHADEGGLSAEHAARKAEIDKRAASIEKEDLYTTLGVERAADGQAVQQAYFALVKKWHPDRLPAPLADVKPVVAKVFARMAEAYQTLSDEKRRADYDATLASGGGTAEADAHVARVVDAAFEFQKAEVLLKKNDLVGAEVLVKRALLADPDQPEYLVMAAWLQALRRPDPPALAEGQTTTFYDDLIKTLDAVIGKNPSFERAIFYRGMLLKRAGRHDKAIRDFSRVASINPKNLDAVREVRVWEMRSKGASSTGNKPAAAGKSGDAGLLGKLFKK
jgi:curved DNA-binding protein CbpA